VAAIHVTEKTIGKFAVTGIATFAMNTAYLIKLSSDTVVEPVMAKLISVDTTVSPSIKK